MHSLVSRPVLIVALITSTGLASAQSELPAPLQQAITPIETVPDFAFDVERTTTDTGEDGETHTAYARVNLNAEPLKQITPAHLIDPSLPGSSFRALADIESTVEDGIWCAGLVENAPDPEDVEVIAEDETTITYQFTPGLAEDADRAEKKMQKRMRVTVVVSRDNPAILSYTRRLTKPVTIYVVAKIKSLESTANCARGPSGQTYIQESTNRVEASGLGESGGNNSSMQITGIYDAVTGVQLAAN